MEGKFRLYRSMVDEFKQFKKSLILITDIRKVTIICDSISNMSQV